jgi:phospholipid-binding lipoprotein MlaA
MLIPIDLDFSKGVYEKGLHMMKRFSFLAFLVAFFTVGCAHNPSPVSSLSSASSSQPQWVMVVYDPGQEPLKSPTVLAASGSGNEEEKKSPGDPLSPHGPSKSSPEMPIQYKNKSSDQQENLKDEEETGEEKSATIADPLEPFNRAMFHFNDKLYFWVLKPVARGYSKVVPEPARVSAKNFFSNLRFPIRFISCLLQADFRCVATEFGRFTVNTVWGVGGLLDPASSDQLNIPKREADLGQTLGVYGIGQGFYIVWPVLGPSSARDSIEIAGEYFVYPVSYITPWYDWLGVRSYEVVNATSLQIGDYESLKEAAIDPYVALRDAYVQYRQGMVKAAKGKTAPPKPGAIKLE